jgi:hypothetical protein
MKTILVTLMVLLNANSYQSDKYKLIEKDDLKSAFIINSSPTFKGYFYMGTDSGYHYFESRWDFQKDRYYKIHKADLKVNEPFDLGTKELRIDLLDNTKTIFGVNEYYKLFIIDK